ncbi:chemotaxis protein CheW [Psychrobacter sp. AOP22-C1-22]|uniref:chemotaxis protein CheW n=1 Tax=unclassified Psychrobacter TaxID=196806 RepID=UPI001788648D|nr:MULTISPECIES: chemotaxis protein CheW [unclassified Psychrobacter]MDN5802917.1 chemotaxis protein CheW [Psychrobacter sp.]MBE0407003.1 chemotaxis protein CheW [Psychrobacter sp. FME6]MBE0445376.1 chemotaxis protein CheW [Psychrobacter sp. FME5]MDN5891957.1 chemotaxis protein CheW [Psychrobacter sp.]MDN5898214.1 chemotaxis protein CheW [Psychrobacter sp.]
MASRGFIELLRLADLARARKSGRRGGQEFDWQGVVFEIGGQRMVAPMGQVSEVLTMPEYTSLPLVKPWMLGIANIRGRLLPLTDLSQFLQVPSRLTQMSQRKVIVIEHDTVFSGLLVDQVLGIEQFTQDQYRPEAIDANSPFAPYNHGKFFKNDQDWYTFMPSLLVQDLQYTDAAI